ncbi:hypothetical protein [Pseudolactococcus yaeyamensis]
MTDFSIPRLHGEIWSRDIELEVDRFIARIKIHGENREEVHDIVGYFYKQMMNFWKKALILEARKDIEILDLISMSESGESIMRYFYPDKQSLKDTEKDLELLELDLVSEDINSY